MSLSSFAHLFTSPQPFFAGQPPRRRARFCLLTAFGLTLLVTALAVLNDQAKGPDDDLGIAMVLSTLYPGAGQCPFTSSVLNLAISFLNVQVPGLNGMLVVERLTSAVALLCLGYGALRWLPRGFASALFGFVVILIYPLCTVSANFTVVAGLSVFAGETLLCLSAAHRSRGLAAIGVLLTLLGYLWRASMLLLSLPFFLGALAVTVFNHVRTSQVPLSALVKPLACALAALALLVGLCTFVHQTVWSDPELSAWQAYSDARSELCDYPTKPYEEIADELRELGVSENDYWCMTHWITADPSYFTTERLREVGAIAAEPARINIVQAAHAELGALATRQLDLAVALGCLALIAGLMGGRKTVVTMLLSFSAAFAACLYFRLTGRFPTRVEYPLWLFSLLPLGAVLASLPPSQNNVRARASVGPSQQIEGIPTSRKAGTALGLVAGAVCLVVFVVQLAPTFNAQRIDQFQSSSSFAQEQPLIEHFSDDLPSADALYIWDPSAYSALEAQLNYRFLPPQSFMDHNLLAGGWTQGSAFIAANNARREATNPLQSLVDRPDTYFVARKRSTVKHVFTFLREHVDENIRKKTVEKIEFKPGKHLYVVEFRVKDAQTARP